MLERFLQKEGKEKKSKKGAVAGLAALGALTFGVDTASAVQAPDSFYGFQTHMPVQTELKPAAKLVSRALTAIDRFNEDRAGAKSSEYQVIEMSERERAAVDYARIDFQAFLIAYNRSVVLAGGNSDLVVNKVLQDVNGPVADEVREVVEIMRHILRHYSKEIRRQALYELMNEQDPADVGE